MALSADRNTPRRTGEVFTRPVKATLQIFAGALVCLDADGFAVPGTVAATLTADGRSQENVTGGAADGDVMVSVRPGIFRWKNSADADLITAAMIGDNCYVVDDETVAATSDTAARSVAGRIVDVDAEGVWVLTGQAVFGI